MKDRLINLLCKSLKLQLRALYEPTGLPDPYHLRRTLHLVAFRGTKPVAIAGYFSAN